MLKKEDMNDEMRREIEKLPRTPHHRFVFPYKDELALRNVIENARQQASPLEAMRLLESAVSFQGPNRLAVLTAMKHAHLNDTDKAVECMTSISGYRYDVQVFMRTISKGHAFPPQLAALATFPPEMRRLRYHDPIVCKLYAAMAQCAGELGNASLAEEYALMCVRSAYHDWILTGNVRSHARCVFFMFRLGSLYLQQTKPFEKGLLLILFAVLSGQGAHTTRARTLLQDVKPHFVVNLVLDVIDTGYNLYHERVIAKACEECLGCHNARLQWIRTAQRSTFVEWLLDSVGEDAVSTWPFMAKDAAKCIQTMIHPAAPDDTSQYIVLCTALDAAFSTLRPYDIEVRDILSQMAAIHGRKRRFETQIMRLRQCLQLSYVDSVVFPRSSYKGREPWIYMRDIMRCKIQVLHFQYPNDEKLARSILDICQVTLEHLQEPILHIGRAYAQLACRRPYTAWKEWTEYWNTRSLSIIEPEEQLWEQHVRGRLEEAGFVLRSQRNV
jgi:hypothetical protein